MILRALLASLAFGTAAINAAPLDPFKRTWDKQHAKQLKDQFEALKNDKLTHYELSPNLLGTFDGKTVLLAGKYIARPDSSRSALLVSRNGGKTWVDSAPWLGGCYAYSLFILNKTTAWLVTCWSIEGQQAPFNIFRTTDAARTWKKVDPDLPLPGDFGTSLCRMETIHFKDDKHGQAIFSGSVNVNIKAYETMDGREHWKISFNHMHKEVEKDFVASDVIEFPKQPKRNVPEFKAETDYDGN